MPSSDLNRTWQNKLKEVQAHTCHHIKAEVGNPIGGPESHKHRKESGTTPISIVSNPLRARIFSAMTNRQRSDPFRLPESQSVDSVGSVLVVSIFPLFPPILPFPSLWNFWNWPNVWLLNSASAPTSL